jgi:hypothetical protein
MRTRGLGASIAHFRRYGQAVEGAYVGAAEDTAEHITDWERDQHAWQNQTGRAERGLQCHVEVEGGVIRLINEQTDEERQFLEFIYEGRYAILREAVRRFWFPFLAEGKRRAAGQAAQLRGRVSG